MAERQPTVAELETEIEETQKDLVVFMKVRDTLQQRVQEQIDYPAQGRLLPTIVEWSGTSAVLGTLDLSIHSLERVLGELRQKHATLTGNRRGLFSVVTGGVDEQE